MLCSEHLKLVPCLGIDVALLLLVPGRGAVRLVKFCWSILNNISADFPRGGLAEFSFRLRQFRARPLDFGLEVFNLWAAGNQ